MRPYINFSSCSETGPCTGSVGYFGQWYPWDPATPCHYPELRLHVIGTLRGIGKQNASSCLMSPSPQPILSFPSLIFWVQLSRQLVSTKWPANSGFSYIRRLIESRVWVPKLNFSSLQEHVFICVTKDVFCFSRSIHDKFIFLPNVCFLLFNRNKLLSHTSSFLPSCSALLLLAQSGGVQGDRWAGGLAFLALQTQTISQLQPGSQTWLQKSADSLKPLVPLMSSP